MSGVDATELTRHVQLALERTAFLFTEPAGEGDAPAPVATRATVAFSGAAEGRVGLEASEGFVRRLVAGVLGTEPEEVDPRAMGQDAINELGNIVAGLVVRSLGGEGRQINLGLPAPGWSVPAGISATRVEVEAEGDRLRVTLALTKAA